VKFDLIKLRDATDWLVLDVRISKQYCRCSGYRGIPVHLLLGLFNGPASAQGVTMTEAVGEDPHEEAPHEENDD
jgi:hypothetical protein